MHDDTPRPTPRLTDMQTTRLDFAQRDLELARAMDLSQLEPDAMIILIARLCTRLDDALQLITEITEP